MFQCLILALIMAAFVLRIFHLDYQSLWRDEVDAIRFSSQPFLNLTSARDITDLLIQPGHNGPLYFIVLHYWRLLTGDSEFALRYFSLIAGVLMVALTYRVARQLRIGSFARLTGTLIVATSPYLIWYSQEAKMYTWLACLVLLAIYAYQSALVSKQSVRWWALFIFVMSLSFYTHILVPLMVPVYVVWGGLQWRQLQRQWRRWLIAMLSLILPYLPLVWWQIPLLLNRFESGHPFYTISEQISLLLHLYSVGIMRTSFRIWAMMLMAFLGSVGLLMPKIAPNGTLHKSPTANPYASGIVSSRLMRHMGSSDNVPKSSEMISYATLRFQLGIWLILPALMVHLISLRVAIFEDRYLIYLIPAYAMLVGLGVDVIRHRIRWFAWPTLVAVIGFGLWSGWLQSEQIIKPDFRAAAIYIEGRMQEAEVEAAEIERQIDYTQLPFKVYIPMIRSISEPEIMIQMPYLHHTFGYYFASEYRPLDGIWTNDGRSTADAKEAIRQGLVEVSELWLVVSEEDLWDSRRLTRSWLDQHGRLVDEAHFVGVDVYRYMLTAE